MPASPDELTVARSWIGSEAAESDIVFNERYDRLGDLDAAITESLRSQISILVESPASVRLPSGLAINVGDNIKALSDRLKSFLASGGTAGSGVSIITKIFRPDYR